jgi:hypothetical protein
VQRIILGLSDQQLITGFAVLLPGFIRIPYSTGNLKSYHLVLVADMAWLASNTHLLTLFALQRYFQDHPVALALRAGMMLLLACGLVIVSILTGHRHTWDYYKCPVQCLLQDLNIGGIPGRWMIANISMVIYGYSLALMPLFNLSRMTCDRVIRKLEDCSRRSRGHPALKILAKLLKFVVRDFLFFDFVATSLS